MLCYDIIEAEWICHIEIDIDELMLLTQLFVFLSWESKNVNYNSSVIIRSGSVYSFGGNV